MWTRHVREKVTSKKKKRQKKALPMFLPFFFLSFYIVLLACLLCIISPASYGEGNPALLHPRHTSVSPRAFPEQHKPWEEQGQPSHGVLGGWAVSGRRQRGLVEAACCESPCTSQHCAESHGQAAASLPRFAWSRYLHFSLLLVIFISQGLMP